MIFALAVSVMAMSQTSSDVKKAIITVNDTWQKAHPEPEYGGSKAGLSAFWDNAVYHTGNMESYRLINAERWLKYSFDWAETNAWSGAKERDCTKWKYKTYGEGNDFVLFGDWQICFQTYIDEYNLNPMRSEKMIQRATEVMRYEAESSASDYWWWADALYMAMPVMTKMFLLTGDEKYIEKAMANFLYADSIMYDTETGLYFRDGKYVFPKHTTAAGKKDFWARGDGWVLAAFAKVLIDLENQKGKSVKAFRKLIEKRYKRMAKSVVACQQEEGYWTRSMMDAAQAPGYETSGTALFTYGLAWGVRTKRLPKCMKPAVMKAWNYLSTVALQSDGTIGYVQPIGEKAIPGQVVDRHSTANFGVGAWLLAACEVARLLDKD